MTEQMNTLLDVRHLSVSFESYDAKLQKVIFTAVKDMSLTLEKRKNSRYRRFQRFREKSPCPCGHGDSP